MSRRGQPRASARRAHSTMTSPVVPRMLLEAQFRSSWLLSSTCREPTVSPNMGDPLGLMPGWGYGKGTYFDHSPPKRSRPAARISSRQQSVEIAVLSTTR